MVLLPRASSPAPSVPFPSLPLSLLYSLPLSLVLLFCPRSHSHTPLAAFLSLPGPLSALCNSALSLPLSLYRSPLPFPPKSTAVHHRKPSRLSVAKDLKLVPLSIFPLLIDLFLSSTSSLLPWCLFFFAFFFFFSFLSFPFLPPSNIAKTRIFYFLFLTPSFPFLLFSFQIPRPLS